MVDPDSMRRGGGVNKGGVRGVNEGEELRGRVNKGGSA